MKPTKLIYLISTLFFISLVIFISLVSFNSPINAKPVITSTVPTTTPVINIPTTAPVVKIPTTAPVPDTRCIITVDNQKYDVTVYQNQHSGGNIFNCGTDMSAIFHQQHNQRYLNLMQPYRI